MKRLEEVAEVFVGQIMTRVSSKDEEGENKQVIIPGAIEPGYLIEGSLGKCNLVKELDDKFYTKAGDLVMKLTPDYDVALIGEEQEGMVISSFICVIRPYDEGDTGYLCAVLNSRRIKNRLIKKATGAIRPMMKISDIRALEIPMIPETERKDLGKTYMLSKEKIQILKEMIQNEKDIMDAVVDKMIKEEK